MAEEEANKANGGGSSPGVEDTNSSKFEKALQSWAELDLPALQKTLDQQGFEIKEQQKTSLLSRKELATKTKEFRKLEDEDKLEQIKNLLKLYQNEIDNLTKKNKSVESYFFGVYRSISEAPDPKPLLEASLDAVYDSTEVDGLKEEVNKLNLKLARLADYDQLKDRMLKSEQRATDVLNKSLKAKEDEFQALLDEKERNWQQKEIELSRQVTESRKQIEELTTSQEVTQLKLQNQNNELGENGGSRSSSSIIGELELVRRDAQAAQARAFELEKRNEQLRRDITITKSGMETERLKELNDTKLAELESENALLIARLEHQRRSYDTGSNQSNAKIDTLTREVGQLTTEVGHLKQKLAVTFDYDDIKTELILLKQIEFGQEEDEAGDVDGGAKSQVESILMSRNKKLTQEVAEFRATHDSLLTKIQSLESQLDGTTKELTKFSQLNTKLENDLADFHEINTGAKFDTMSIISGISKVGPLAGTRSTRGGRVSPASSIAGGFNPDGPSLVQQDPSILPIVTKQRDRFRNRNKELEEDLKKQFNTISELKRTINKLKKDNEELYERIRYLSSFSSQSQAVKRKELKTTQASIVVDLEGNYQQNYEERLHPIEKFRQQEQERINSKLSPLERIFISFARAILATRASRMLFMCYCFGLHCVVMFMTMYVMGLSTSLVPEVGINYSTGGMASGAGSAISANNVAAEHIMG